MGGVPAVRRLTDRAGFDFHGFRESNSSYPRSTRPVGEGLPGQAAPYFVGLKDARFLLHHLSQSVLKLRFCPVSVDKAPWTAGRSCWARWRFSSSGLGDELPPPPPPPLGVLVTFPLAGGASGTLDFFSQSRSSSMRGSTRAFDLRAPAAMMAA